MKRLLEEHNAVAQSLKARSPLRAAVFVGLADGMANSSNAPADETFAHNSFRHLTEATSSNSTAR